MAHFSESRAATARYKISVAKNKVQRLQSKLDEALEEQKYWTAVLEEEAGK